MCRSRLLIFVSLLSLASLSFAQPQLSGAQSGILDPGVYDVVGNIWINSQDTWELMPGVELRFYENTMLDVDGWLRAFGTEGDSIRFIRRFENQPWRGIKVNNNGRTGWMTYCVVTGSNEIGLRVEHYGSLRLRNSRVSNNSDINEEGGGIWWESPVIDSLLSVTVSNNVGPGIIYRLGRLHLRDCEISGNTGSGVYTYGAHIDFSNSMFKDNGNSGVWIGTSSGGSIDSCSFIGNESDYGAGCRLAASSIFIRRCLFKNNHAVFEGGGFYSIEWTNGFVVHCVFDNNFAGTNGCAITMDGPDIVNNVIINNYGSNSAVHILDDWMHCLYNDFYGNQGLDLVAEPGQLSDNFGFLVDTNINGDSTDVYGNIFLDPLFTAPQDDDYTLLQTSPCIDAAHPDSTYDPDSTIADIGIHYYDQSAFVPEVVREFTPDRFGIARAYPNPFNSTVSLVIDMPRPSEVDYSVYTITGQLIESDSFGWISGRRVVSWTAPESLASGVYLVRVQAGDRQATRRVVYLK